MENSLDENKISNTTPIKPSDPLHGVSLKKIVTDLEAWYGWAELAEIVRINCFDSNPSINSSLKFLRKTPWARAKVEKLYLWTLKHPVKK